MQSEAAEWRVQALGCHCSGCSGLADRCGSRMVQHMSRGSASGGVVRGGRGWFEVPVLGLGLQIKVLE
jgi:hypothetical protein